MQQANRSPVTCDVLIAGGGLSGLSLAAGCARDGVSVALLDKREPSRVSDNRTTALSTGTRNFYTHLGIWDDLKTHACPIQTIAVEDGATGARLDFPKTEEPLGYIIENHHLRRALLAAIDGVPFIRGELKDIAPDRTAAVTTKTAKDEIHARLLVGADRRRSTVRRIARIRTKQWRYPHTALVFIISHTRSHEHQAFELFYPQGPLATLPMYGPGSENRSQVVWSLPPERAQELLTENAVLSSFQATFGDRLGDLELQSDIETYPLSFNNAYTYVSERIALVGDAAHGLHPIAGQGFNLGLRDVAVLLEELEQPERSLPEALRNYDRKRRPDVLGLCLMTDGIARLFATRNPLVQAARKAGMTAIQHTPAFKYFLAARAMATGIEMPKTFQKAA